MPAPSRCCRVTRVGPDDRPRLPGRVVDLARLAGPQGYRHRRVGGRARVGGGHPPDPYPPVPQVPLGDVLGEAGVDEALENGHAIAPSAGLGLGRASLPLVHPTSAGPEGCRRSGPPVPPSPPRACPRLHLANEPMISIWSTKG